MEKTIFEIQPENTLLVCDKLDFGYRLCLSGDELVNMKLHPDEAESLALALLDDLGKGWKPYPENEPETGMRYLITTGGVIDYPITAEAVFKKDKDAWYTPDGNFFFVRVTAFMELPAPYQPEEQ